MEIETYPIALEAMVGLARFLANNQSTRVQALEYLSLAMQHPASSHATKAQALQLFAASESMFSIDVMLFTAQKKTEPKTLEEMVHEILKQSVPASGHVVKNLM